ANVVHITLNAVDDLGKLATCFDCHCGVMVLDPNLDPMGAVLATTGHHRTKQALAVLSENPQRNTPSDTADHKAFRFLQPVTMKTPAASAIVTIFNRIKSGSNAEEWATLGPPVIQSARRHALGQARDVIGWPHRALRGRALIRAAERAPIWRGCGRRVPCSSAPRSERCRAA